jgi:hypothetical protein
MQMDVYGGTPDQRFTWYASTLAVNSAYNFGNQNNLDGESISVAANDPTCRFFNAFNGSTHPCGTAFKLPVPISHAIFWGLVNPSAVIRDNVLNLHYGVLHHGLTDDVQALYVVGSTGNPFPYSGGTLNPELADAPSFDNFGNPIFPILWPSGQLSTDTIGQPYTGSFKTLTWPTSNGDTGAMPLSNQDHQNTESAIEKLSYTHEFTASSFLRLYAYSLYSLWAFDQPTNPYVGDSFYQLHDNATGYTLNYQDQLNSQHLLRFDLDYVKDRSLRYNYAPDFFGFDNAPDPTGSGDISGNVLCGSIAGGTSSSTSQFVNCGAGTPVAFKAAPYAYWNNLPDVDTDVALADSYHASDNLLFDIGARLDQFHIELTPLQITGPNGIAEQAQDQFGTCLDGYSYASTDPCFGYLTNVSGEFGLPNILPGAANWQNVSGSLDFNEFSPRFGVTYTLPDRDVLRLSVGRYVEPPNTYGEEYIAAPVWGAGDTVSVLNNFYDGLGFLAVHNVKPQDSTNYDASYER